MEALCKLKITYTHTHTHTHALTLTHTHICLCVCVHIYAILEKYLADSKIVVMKGKTSTFYFINSNIDFFKPEHLPQKIAEMLALSPTKIKVTPLNHLYYWSLMSPLDPYSLILKWQGGKYYLYIHFKKGLIAFFIDSFSHHIPTMMFHFYTRRLYLYRRRVRVS